MGVAEFVAENFLKSATNEEETKNISKILESENTKKSLEIQRFPKNRTPTELSVGVRLGAGYGNRTRLHGLGSRCITDIRILHLFPHYSKGARKIQPVFVGGTPACIFSNAMIFL